MSGCVSLLCSEGAKKVYMGAFAAVTLTAYPLAIYYEYNDGSLVEKVAQIFAKCASSNISVTDMCCVAGWSQIIVQEHHIPMMSVVSTVAMPLLAFGLGMITQKLLPAACNAKGRHEYTPVPTVTQTHREYARVTQPFQENEF